VAIEVKIVDKDATDPISGKNIFYELDNMQSCNWCFPIMMLIAKDDKDTYNKYLRDAFKFCDRLHTLKDLMSGSHSRFLTRRI
jgi:hypothetical protein